MVSAESNDKDARPRILYIAGYGRSGSTLLDCILGSHEQMFGTGEFTHLFNELINDAKCSCLEPVRTCPFWNEVLSESGKALGKAVDFSEARAVTRKVERIGPDQSESADGKQYLALWDALYRAVGKVSGRQIIVDSSKNTRITWRRAATLHNSGNWDLKAIHLVRDPRAVMYSVNRGHNDRLEEGKQQSVMGGYFRGLWGWTLSSYAVKAMKKQIGAENVLLLRYEDLVEQPFVEIERIGQFMGIEVTALCELIRNEDPIDPGHGVSGNRMRRKGGLKFKKDTEWERGLPGYARLAAKLVWPIAKSYGYSWTPRDSKPLTPTAARG